jgi:hypothetical protein
MTLQTTQGYWPTSGDERQYAENLVPNQFFLCNKCETLMISEDSATYSQTKEFVLYVAATNPQLNQ